MLMLSLLYITNILDNFPLEPQAKIKVLGIRKEGNVVQIICVRNNIASKS